MGVTEKLPRPDVSLRKRILHYKASKNGLDVLTRVLDYIAENTAGSVRELEGIVMGILTRSITLNVPISLEMARSVMRNSVKPIKKTINFDIIVDATAEHYGLNPDVIFSKAACVRLLMHVWWPCISATNSRNFPSKPSDVS